MPTIKLHYSESLIRRAIKAFWWRTTGPVFLLALALLSLSLCFSLWRGDRSWWVGAIGSILAVGIAFAIALYVIHFRGSMARFRRMRVPEAMIELSEERLKLSSDAGTSELPWNAITEVWRFPDFWLLFISKAQFFTLPAADLDADAREFILAKADAHGTKLS